MISSFPQLGLKSFQKWAKRSFLNFELLLLFCFELLSIFSLFSLGIHNSKGIVCGLRPSTGTMKEDCGNESSIRNILVGI